MKRNSDLQTRFPAFYRHDKLKAKRIELGFEIQDVSRDTGIPYGSIQRAESGTASNKIVYPLARHYGLPYEELFMLPGAKRSRQRPQRLHLAVSGNGGSLSAG
jgi:hypothetical protein